jgi:hypothetical protein
VRRYFRLEDADADPQIILEPENQVSRPWGGADHGPCDKCRRSGRTAHRCESCIATEPDPDCEFCGGRVEFDDECPTCRGSGEISDSQRNGVSVFPRPEGLLRYMIKRGTDLNGCRLVELEGERTGDVDFDGDQGALLVRPTRVVSATELDPRLVERLERDVAARS